MKKETGTKNIYFAVIVLAAVLFSGCFISGTTGELVSPTIRAIGLPDADTVGSVTLRVTGPDMEPVEVSYSQLPSVINIAIPEGQNRTFELTVNTGSSYIGPVKSYKGTATASIDADNAVVTLNMGIGSTKLIVPDANNNRLVQIDDMSGSGWKVLKNSDVSAAITTFSPWDVDFDQYGNIYVANNDNPSGGIYRFSSIIDKQPIPVLQIPNAVGAGGFRGMTAVAVDRINSIVYGIDDTDSSVVHYVSLETGELGAITSVTVTIILGLATDEEGDVYLLGTDNNTGVCIEKYEAKTAVLIDSFSDWSGDFAIPGDGIVKKDTLYASSFDGNIYVLDTSNISSGVFDTLVGSIASARPTIFISTINDEMTFIDDDGSTDRLISINSQDPTNWNSLGTNGSNEKQFLFYEGSFYNSGAPQ